MVCGSTPQPSSREIPQQSWQSALRGIFAASLAEAIAAELTQELSALSRVPTVTFELDRGRVSKRVRRFGPVTVSTATGLFISIYPDDAFAATQLTAHLPRSRSVPFWISRVAIHAEACTVVDGWPTRVSAGEIVGSGRGRRSESAFAHCGILIANAVVEGVGETQDQAIDRARVGLAGLVRVCERLIASSPSPGLSPSTLRWPDPADYGLNPGVPQGESDDSNPESASEPEESTNEDAEVMGEDEIGEEEEADHSSILCPYCGKPSCAHEVDSWDDSVANSSGELGTFYRVMSAALDTVEFGDVDWALPTAELHNTTKQLLSALGQGWDDWRYLDWLGGSCGVSVDSRWWEGTLVSGTWHVAFHPSTRYLTALLEAVEVEALDWLDELMDEDDEGEDEEDREDDGKAGAADA